jgi:poly [ADP-ribose] polymerase
MELVKIDPQQNRNMTYRLTDENGIITIEFGRVGSQLFKRMAHSNNWDALVQQKLNEGFVDRTNLVKPTVTHPTDGFEIIPDEQVREMFSFLMRATKKQLQDTYRVDFNEVTPVMLEQAYSLLSQMSMQKNLDEFNRLLAQLFVIIPRKMKDVTDHLAKRKQNRMNVLLREIDYVDSLAAQVKTETILNTPKKEGTILDALGLSIRTCTKEETANIKKHLGEESRQYFRRAFRVNNHKLDERFYNYVAANGISDDDIHFLYHGSRNMNWYGLLTQGQKLNPDAPITGKMFGQGLYYANRAKKSINYTGIEGAYWTNGKEKKAYLAVYKVAYKNPKHLYKSDREMNQFTGKKIAPHDAVFAHQATGFLFNDEIIVYNESQSTLMYLIELGV